MVTREYKCKKCGNTFELVQSIKDPPIKECKCGEELIQKYGTENKILWFNNPHCGAISKRFL